MVTTRPKPSASRTAGLDGNTRSVPVPERTEEPRMALGKKRRSETAPEEICSDDEHSTTIAIRKSSRTPRDAAGSLRKGNQHVVFEDDMEAPPPKSRARSMTKAAEPVSVDTEPTTDESYEPASTEPTPAEPPQPLSTPAASEPFYSQANQSQQPDPNSTHPEITEPSPNEGDITKPEPVDGSVNEPNATDSRLFELDPAEPGPHEPASAAYRSPEVESTGSASAESEHEPTTSTRKKSSPREDSDYMVSVTVNEPPMPDAERKPSQASSKPRISLIPPSEEGQEPIALGDLPTVPEDEARNGLLGPKLGTPVAKLKRAHSMGVIGPVPVAFGKRLKRRGTVVGTTSSGKGNCKAIETDLLKQLTEKLEEPEMSRPKDWSAVFEGVRPADCKKEVKRLEKRIRFAVTSKMSPAYIDYLKQKRRAAKKRTTKRFMWGQRFRLYRSESALISRRVKDALLGREGIGNLHDLLSAQGSKFDWREPSLDVDRATVAEGQDVR